jgi:hypothetical protein
LPAFDALMHAPNREGRLAVIEVRVRTNPIPTDFGVAALTGHGQVSMRISRPSFDGLGVRRTERR